MSQKMIKNVTVLLGGWSAEREVSLASGKACAEALQQAGYIVTQLDPPRDMAKFIAALTPKPDAIFNALHGKYGEDGTVQAMLNMMQIPYSHSGQLASCLAMDKPMTIAIAKAAGIPCAKGMVVAQNMLGANDPMPRPYVVKPASEGSSVGIYIVKNDDNSPNYNSWNYGDALVEEFIDGMELTVSVMSGNSDKNKTSDIKALCVTELKPHNGFYDYEAKYQDGKTTHICPADIDENLASQIKLYAIKAHQILGCRGISRSDFRYDPKLKKLAFLEINTQPGMMSLSLVPEQAKYMGIDFSELVSWMVENSACDH